MSLKSILAQEGVLRQKRASSETPKRFTREDWYGYAGAEAFPDGSQPFIAYVDTPNMKATGLSFRYDDDTESKTANAALVGDAGGVGLYFASEDGDQGPMYHLEINEAEPEEVEGLMKAAIRTLKSGRIPPRFKHIN